MRSRDPQPPSERHNNPIVLAKLTGQLDSVEANNGLSSQQIHGDVAPYPVD
jgi:hypothetical protein